MLLTLPNGYNTESKKPAVKSWQSTHIVTLFCFTCTYTYNKQKRLFSTTYVLIIWVYTFLYCLNHCSTVQISTRYYTYPNKFREENHIFSCIEVWMFPTHRRTYSFCGGPYLWYAVNSNNLVYLLCANIRFQFSCGNIHKHYSLYFFQKLFQLYWTIAPSDSCVTDTIIFWCLCCV
jgi:hypothetical protein